jgi:D-alanyl-D-alanine carboxypeptidase
MRHELLPAPLLAEMRTPHGKFGLGLGLWVQDLGPDGGTIVHHNGGAPEGYGALMISTPDGGKTLTASLTTGTSTPADPNHATALSSRGIRAFPPRGTSGRRCRGSRLPCAGCSP